ncbi:hypothetical protein FEM03_17865 [Phragmitibacter flavus]|uniref:Uncharacterized protein n=1 Tax=Phragmitibacter flavus TaxID=2576071 RepID=A0A5R8KB13_9BACT|nr:hypothetical protein FEM03_17865 [Phragmitibacter flavus]
MCFTCACLISQSTAFTPPEQTEKLDPTLINEVYGLVVGGTPYTSEMSELEKNPDKAYVKQALEKLRQEQRRIKDEDIRTRPGLKPYIYSFLRDHYKPPDRGNEDAIRILKALALRDDLDVKDVEAIKQEVIKNLGTPFEAFKFLPAYFLEGAVVVLARDFTEENEDLIIRVMTDYPYWNASVEAALVLTNAGSVKALPAMDKFIEQLKAKNDESGADNIKRLKARLEAKIAAGQALTPDSRPRLNFSPTVASTPKPSKPATPSQSNEWFIWLAAAIAVGGCTWLVFRKLLK